MAALVAVALSPKAGLAAHVLALRALAHCAARPAVAPLVAHAHVALFSAVVAGTRAAKSPVRVAAATVLLNSVVLACAPAGPGATPEVAGTMATALGAAAAAATGAEDEEAVYRLLVAASTACTGAPFRDLLAGPAMANVRAQLQGAAAAATQAPTEKVAEAGAELLELLPSP